MSHDADDDEISQEEKSPDSASDHPDPSIRAIADKDVSSTVAVAGHPLHSMLVHFPIALVIATLGTDIFFWWTGDVFWRDVSVWSAGFAFAFGILAAIVGTVELLAVPGIRVRVASWNHATAAMVLLAFAGTNWGLRVQFPDQVLPHGLFLSLLASAATGFAGWHGGKLVFDHGVGMMISTKE